MNVAADMAIVGALTWGWDVEAAAAFAIVVLPAVDLLFNRIDLWSMASASIGVALWQRNRRAASAMALSAGAAFKLWPLIFAVPLSIIFVWSGLALLARAYTLRRMRRARGQPTMKLVRTTATTTAEAGSEERRLDANRGGPGK